MIQKTLILVLSILAFTSFVYAQDPELLMNEWRVPYVNYSHTSITESKPTQAIGLSVGGSISLCNLFLSNFNKSRFRAGDLISADITMGYTNDPLLFNIWLQGQTKLGLQAYYAINEDIDAGIKAYDLIHIDMDRGYTGILFQPVIRYKRFLLETTTGIENSSTITHYQGTIKFIVQPGDLYKCLSFRYEYIDSKDAYQSTYFSLGYSIHFASNR